MKLIVVEANKVKACRVCLLMNVKMYDLQSYPMESLFEDTTGISVISTMELPLFLCYECATLVKKFSVFKERCLRGQATLYDILHTVGKVTEQDILLLDRKSLLISSTLAAYNTSTELVVTHSDDVEQVKDEPDSVHESDNETQEEDFPPAESPLSAPEAAPLSSDDEPLSVHKALKTEKKKGKKRGRKKKIADQDSRSLEDNTENEEICQESFGVQDMSIVKRKKGRPRKTPISDSAPIRAAPSGTHNKGGLFIDDINLEDYVTIVILTLEEQLAEINKRKESSNYLNSSFQCNLCYKGFIDTNAWKHHIGKHDPSAGPVECEVCKFRFPTRRAQQRHAVNHEKKYACKSCEYVSRTTTQAKLHQRWHEGVTYSCEYCEEVSTKWTSYLSHLRIKHPSQHICGVCGYSFVSQLGLTMHKTMMHKDVIEKSEGPEDWSGPYCQKCDVKFISTEAYNRHMVTSVKHCLENNFSKGCRVCGATFQTPEDLRVHHRAEHARARPRNYGKKNIQEKWPDNCVHCGEMIENAREHWTHFRRVHQDQAYPSQKNYVCDICGKRFRSNAFLKYHKRTHTSERAYKCSTCDKSFFNQTNLTMHMRSHSAARPYPCTVCSKAFKCKGALDRHYRSHTGVKPYECEVCGKAFGQSNSRKLHVRTVHFKLPSRTRTRQDKRKPLASPDDLTDELPFVY